MNESSPSSTPVSGSALTAGSAFREHYPDLRTMAGQMWAAQQSGQTLQATALVSELWLKLHDKGPWLDEKHFLRTASVTLRNFIVDNARRKAAKRNGGGAIKVSVEDLDVASYDKPDIIVAVHEGLEKLALILPRAARLIELRFFHGYDVVKAAELLDIGERTAKREFHYARNWLYAELNPTACGSAGAEIPPG